MLTTGETENPPQTNEEILFVTIDLTVGFFVFAAIVGQFGSMITHMLLVRREFLGQAEAVKQYLVFHGMTIYEGESWRGLITCGKQRSRL